MFSNVQQGTCWEGYVGMKRSGKQDGSQLCSSSSKKMKEGGLTKWFQRKMGRYWSKEKRWQVSRVWKKICQWFKAEVSEMRTTCKSHSDDKVKKGLCCCQKKKAGNTGA